MRIISIRRGFTSDHSSTSYEFLAVDKALGRKERAEVASLSRRAAPTSRRVNFSYQVEGYDVPGGWEELMERYYDVMYREDYGWWTLALAFNTTQEELENLYRYEFTGEDDFGISVYNYGSRTIVAINCRIEMPYNDYSYDEYDEENEDTEDETEFVAEDELLNLLVQVRRQLMNGDYRALYAVYKKYGYPSDEEDVEIPIPEEESSGMEIVKRFVNILD